ncbi:hypothetical protein MMC10_009044 [Thelotrema lepadinum]|nr:hypothetical protein [Thelotrema lepadinum]
MKLVTFITYVFALAVTAQDFVCKPAKFHGPFTSNHAKLQISSGGVVGNLTASTGNQRIAATGTVLQLNSCNSTTLGQSENHDQGCSKGSCVYEQYDYVQAINPATGYCLTRDNLQSITNLTFAPCTAPVSSFDYTQLLFLTQVVRYTPNWSAPPQYEPYNPQIVGVSDGEEGWSWALAADQRTVVFEESGSDPSDGSTLATATLLPA